MPYLENGIEQKTYHSFFLRPTELSIIMSIIRLAGQKISISVGQELIPVYKILPRYTLYLCLSYRSLRKLVTTMETKR